MKTLLKYMAFYFVFGSILISNTACTMQLVEDRRSEVSASILKVAKTTDAFLLNIKVTSSVTGGSRSFDNYAGGYAAVENELVSLRLQLQVQPLNDHAFRVSEIALEMWLEYAQKHEQNDTVSDEFISEMRIKMQTAFRAMMIEDEGELFLLE